MKRLIFILMVGAGFMLAVGCTAPGGNQPTTPPPQEPKSEPPPTATTNDKEIHERVHDALYRNMGDDAGDIAVRVENGEVFLSGCVDSQAQHDRAHDLAHDVKGVTAVYHDELGVC